MKLKNIYEVHITEDSETTKIMDIYDKRNSSGEYIYDTLMLVNAGVLSLKHKNFHTNLYIQRTRFRDGITHIPDISFTDFKKNYSNKSFTPGSIYMDIIGEEICKTLAKSKICLDNEDIDVTMELDEWIPFHAQSSIYRKNTKYGDSSWMHIVGFRLLSSPLNENYIIRSSSPIYDYISNCTEVTTPSLTRTKNSLLKMVEKWKIRDNWTTALLAKNAFSFFDNGRQVYVHLYFKRPYHNIGRSIPLDSFSDLIGGNVYDIDTSDQFMRFYIDKIIRLYHNPVQEYSYKMNWECSMWEELILNVYDYEHLKNSISVQLIKVKFTSKPL